jgi:hypothetical protein
LVWRNAYASLDRGYERKYEIQTTMWETRIEVMRDALLYMNSLDVSYRDIDAQALKDYPKAIEYLLNLVFLPTEVRSAILKLQKEDSD